MQHSTSNILSIFDNIFKPADSHHLAKQSGIIQRSTSKIKGHEFLKALVLPSHGIAKESLNGLCIKMKEFNPEVNITASALAQKINTLGSVRFMKALFEKILKSAHETFEKQYSSLNGCLKEFNNIYIQDSTVFEVNKRLFKHFP